MVNRQEDSSEVTFGIKRSLQCGVEAISFVTRRRHRLSDGCDASVANSVGRSVVGFNTEQEMFLNVRNMTFAAQENW